MVKTMTPSESITQGQIGKIQELLGAALRKSGLPSEAVQQTLERQGDSFVAELMEVVRKHVEANIDMIVRRVKVDRSVAPQEMLNATGRRQYVNNDVVASMPRGEGEETEVYFFRLGRFVSDEELEREYARRGLKPADPYSQSAVNKADPAFADDHPNSTHWKDNNGKWCFSAFYHWFDERDMDVRRNDIDWDDYWWFASLRK